MKTTDGSTYACLNARGALEYRQYPSGWRMARRKDELEVEVLELPAEDRADLARRLIESLDEAPVNDFEAEWIEGAERRYAAYREGLKTARPGQEVLREAKARLK